MSAGKYLPTGEELTRAALLALGTGIVLATVYAVFPRLGEWLRGSTPTGGVTGEKPPP